VQLTFGFVFMGISTNSGIADILPAMELWKANVLFAFVERKMND